MDRKCDLTAFKKYFMISELAKGKSTLELFKIIGRHYQTVKKIVAVPTKLRNRADKGHSRVVSRCHKLNVKL